MSIRYGNKVQEALALGGFTRSKVFAKLDAGDMVLFLRQKNELTQAELARRSGLAQATISSIENHRVKLGVERAKSLARALYVHPATLLFPGWDVDKECAA